MLQLSQIATQTAAKSGANLTYLILGVVLTSSLVFISLIIYFVLKLKKNKKNTNGYIFEQNISDVVKKLSNKKDFHYFPGGTFDYANKMFDVDSFIITPKLLVVFEFKSYKGQLTGNALDLNLVLTDNNSNETISISNPILQNQKHIEHLFKMFEYEFPVASVIVLGDSSSFMVKNVPDDTFLVTPQTLDDVITEIDEWNKSDAAEVINVDTFLYRLGAHKINTIKQNLKWNKMIKNKPRKFT